FMKTKNLNFLTDFIGKKSPILRYSFIFGLTSLLAFQSCKSDKKTDNQKDTTIKDNTAQVLIPSDKIDSAFVSTRDSANKAWNLMTQIDDQLIKDLQRLVEEVSYC